MEYNVHATDVIIVGGGLVGLSASLFLSYFGVRSVLVERHTSTSPQPKARRINVRTMELFRQIGIEREVMEAAAALVDFHQMAVGRTLAEADLLPSPYVPPKGGSTSVDWDAVTPAGSPLCAQDVLEPVLRRLAGERGGDVRFGTEAIDIGDDGDRVRVAVRSEDGRAETLVAPYLIAADGARSPVRERLGISRSGRGTLGEAVNVYFRADLTELVRGREFNLCQVEHPEASGAFVSVNGTDRWIFTTRPVPGRTPDQWAETVRTAIGASESEIKVEVLSVLAWEPGMFVADSFTRGRIFLAGDAAHVMPPFAAAGANTGIQDAHNLAWKLAMVLSGTAPAGLLDSYDAERRPAGWFVADQSSVRTPDLRTLGSASTDGTPLADPIALILGFQYPSGAFVPDGTTAAMDRLDLNGQPGTRVPHRWLSPGRSTLDAVGCTFTLFTGHPSAWPELPSWIRPEATDALGTLLVRPDQIVAWRDPAPGADLASCLRSVQ
jgi:2-polyprenyl-6-methoxyphenol hydroxylase-like FAD-dependent oxidoreductase